VPVLWSAITRKYESLAIVFSFEIIIA